MTELELADWRRRVTGLYAKVRDEQDPAAAHRVWREGRDALFTGHPQSPLRRTDPLRGSGLPYWPYDPALRFVLPLIPTRDRVRESLPTGGDPAVALRRAGSVTLPAPIDASVDVWWLDQYAGGVFLPLRDGTSGEGSYGGGRYLLDTAKGADLGGRGGVLTIDLNFLYHPSCRYDDAWVCPLAPPVTASPRPFGRASGCRRRRPSVAAAAPVRVRSLMRALPTRVNTLGKAPGRALRPRRQLVSERPGRNAARVTHPHRDPATNLDSRCGNSTELLAVRRGSCS